MATETPLRGEHEALGASFEMYFDCVLPERYGDVAAECRVARESVALFDANYLAFTFFKGPDRVRYLNAVLTCNVKDLKNGEGTIGLMLNAQGHILAEIRCLALADRLLTIYHRMTGMRTLETLEKFIIMDDVTTEDATARLACIALEGPAAGAVLADLCGVKIESLSEHSFAENSIGEAPCCIVSASHFGELGADIIVERQAAAQVWEVLLPAARARSGGPVGYQALNVLRLEAGIPWFSYDFDDKVIPHEAALETSHISYTKGCYTGQEIVERVRSRGHANRRRVRLQFRGNEVPTVGAKLLADGKEAGVVTSAAFSPRLQSVIGMGYVRTEFTKPGSVLRWSGGEANVA